ncbi:MAG: ParB/RepB/Spo0J family partition protein [Candidatus Dormibacteria bacterium]
MTPPPRRGLGRGLDALLAGSDPERDPAGDGGRAPTGLIEVDPHLVRPNPEQPRRDFDDASLAALGESIRLHGLLHPIVVEGDGNGFLLVAGERRLRAAQRAGVSTVPAIVRPAAESGRHSLELALTENLMREDLNPMDEAAAFTRLADVFGLSHEAIAHRLSRSRPAVSNAIRLLGLPPHLQAEVASGTLSAGHGRALLALNSEAAQLKLAARIREESLSVRATEEAVRGGNPPGAAAPALGKAPTDPILSPDDDALRRGLERALELPVRLERRRRGGRVVIEFSGDEDLDSIYRRVNGPPL